MGQDRKVTARGSGEAFTVENWDWWLEERGGPPVCRVG